MSQFVFLKDRKGVFHFKVRDEVQIITIYVHYKRVLVPIEAKIKNIKTWSLLMKNLFVRNKNEG